MFEFFVCPLNITSVLLSVALFFWVRQLPGQFLYPYHRQISIFSVLVYFLHMFELWLFRFITDSTVVSFLLVIILNLVLTAVVVNVRRMTREALAL